MKIHASLFAAATRGLFFPIRLKKYYICFTSISKAGVYGWPRHTLSRDTLGAMNIGIDIGGTKTLIAVFDDTGSITAQSKFPTPAEYTVFLETLATQISQLEYKEFKAAAVAVPGTLSRETDIVVAFGNLPWHNVPVRSDVEALVHCPTYIDNDAKLAGLSEALLHPDSRKVLYITISTGIGIAFVVDGQIEENIGDAGGHSIPVEHDGKMLPWESFASGKAIREKYGKTAADITDTEAWKDIAHNLAVGLVDVIALTTPDLVVIGGGVGSHFEHFGEYLKTEMAAFQTALLTIPPIVQAVHPEEAVVYGCYEYIKQQTEKATT